ncbi:MAG: asparagine synthase (glutamine-hydrolyzing) [Thermodesulfobacteriota bacterium]|nr:asparagine synthase (glutamine-hydrolyzing) [Thermodesulfobacteriota bacterium]
MCGICGKLCRDAGSVSEELLTKMCRAIDYRGPDDEGTWLAFKPEIGGVGLGHRRLSVIDLSEAGRQPITNEDKTIRMVFNGEIYNFQEIRQDLIKKGHQFVSETDSEVIVHLYEEDGPECLGKLKGMFAFGLWDDTKNKLFLCRDRLGIKPLVYYQDDFSLIFASEIKALLMDPQVRKEIDWTALGLYLKLNHIPAPWTILKGIKKLNPGHYILVENGELSIHRYWDIEALSRSADGDGSFSYQKQRLYELMNESVKRRLISDVPLGAFLSGGVDSSIIVGLMARNVDRPVETFSIGYEDLPLYDETRYAREVARFNGTDHHEFKVSYRDVLETFPTVLDNLDEPFADSSIIPTYIVSRETRQSVTVALSGDGADELFAGYRKYKGEYWSSYYLLLPEVIRSRVIGPALAILPDSRDTILAEYLRRAKKFIDGAHDSLHGRVCAWREVFADDACQMVLTPEALQLIYLEKAKEIVEDSLNKFDGDPINRMLYVDTTGSLPDDMLNKVDRMSMRNSLEVRVPFLDHEVVEFAFQVEGTKKLHRGQTKHILLETFKSILPPAIHSRPKWGFEVPISVWLRKELRFLVNEYLSEDFIKKQQIFEYDAVRDLVDSHLAKKRDTSWHIWNLIVFGHWYRKYFLNDIS